MLANTMEIPRIEINCDHTRNERKIYGLIIIQYSKMDFTNYSSCINAISLDVEMPLSRRTISSGNKQFLNSNNRYISNN